MTKLMYDSTSPGAIPADAPVVAGYADGRYQWSAADWARFPRAIKVSIACFPASQADILDVETGCASPTDVPGWLDRYDRPVFKRPTLYVNRSNWNAVRLAVDGRAVDYWVATLDGTQVVAGAAAVQYTDTGAYDVSLCQDWWPRLMDQATFDALLAGNPDFQRLIWRVDAILHNRPLVLGGPSQGEGNELNAALAKLAGTGNLGPVLDAVAALKADLDALTLKKA